MFGKVVDCCWWNMLIKKYPLFSPFYLCVHVHKSAQIRPSDKVPYVSPRKLCTTSYFTLLKQWLSLSYSVFPKTKEKLYYWSFYNIVIFSPAKTYTHPCILLCTFYWIGWKWKKDTLLFFPLLNRVFLQQKAVCHLVSLLESFFFAFTLLIVCSVVLVVVTQDSWVV